MDDRLPGDVYLSADLDLWLAKDSCSDQSLVQRSGGSGLRSGGGDGRLHRSRVEMTAETKPDRTFSAAKQLYAEQFGDSIVTNTYLKIALLAMALVCAGLIYANLKTVRMVQNFKPLVIRISDIGRA